MAFTATGSVPADGPGSAAAQVGPVVDSERIIALDSLRGFAVLGILVMNVYLFAMPYAAYSDPLRWGGSDMLNLGIWFATHLFADQKFITIFSILFGAGIVLQTQRAEQRGVAALKLFGRRQGGLMLIGLVHGYLLWFGDILFLYGLIGLPLVLLRLRRARTLLLLGSALLLVWPLASVGIAQYMAELKVEAGELSAQLDAGTVLTAEQQERLEEWEENRRFMAPTDVELDEQVAVYRQGSYGDMFKARLPLVSQSYFSGLFTYGWRIAGLMLLGMAFLKSGVLSAERSIASYGWLAVVGYGVGLPLAGFSAVELAAHQFDALYMLEVGGHYNYVASLLVALGHIGLVMWLACSGRVAGLLGRLAAVGRMALSNYLLHTVVMTSVFYSYGLGLFGQVERYQQMILVAGLLAFQLLISPWWLKYFRYGPAEWLWRSLTYGGWQPFRQRAPNQI